jgi:hypothetical protein
VDLVFCPKSHEYTNSCDFGACVYSYITYVHLCALHDSFYIILSTTSNLTIGAASTMLPSWLPRRLVIITSTPGINFTSFTSTRFEFRRCLVLRPDIVKLRHPFTLLHALVILTQYAPATYDLCLHPSRMSALLFVAPPFVSVDCWLQPDHLPPRLLPSFLMPRASCTLCIFFHAPARLFSSFGWYHAPHPPL